MKSQSRASKNSATSNGSKDKAEKSADNARETDTREAMCLMIEFGGQGATTCRWSFSPA